MISFQFANTKDNSDIHVTICFSFHENSHLTRICWLLALALPAHALASVAADGGGVRLPARVLADGASAVVIVAVALACLPDEAFVALTYTAHGGAVPTACLRVYNVALQIIGVHLQMHIRILHYLILKFIDNSPFLIRTRTCPSNADLITWLSTAALAVHSQVDLQRPLTAHRVHFDDRIPIFLVVWAFEGLSKCSIYFPQSLPYLTFLPVLLKTNKLKLPTYNASISPYRDLHLELDLVPDIESLARGSLLHLPVLALAEETH